MELFEQLANKIKGQNKTLVFPEGEDARVQGAAVRLAADGLVKPILLGKQSLIDATAEKHQFDLSNLTVIDPASYPDDKLKKMIHELIERRHGKTDTATAKKWVADVNYFGTMLVYKIGRAHV